MLTRRLFLGSALAAPLVARPAFAASPDYFAIDGIAIRGTDPVAYFEGAGPVAGSPEHALMWRGATWHFASAANRAPFEADADRFAPRYGGYCAYAVSKGGLATTDPAAWTIHEGQLYLNFSLNVRGIWSQDIPGNIARADANWPAVLA